MSDVLSLTACVLVVVLLIILPGAWFASELYARKWTRIALGIMTMIVYVFLVAFLFGLGIRFESNHYYGNATANLIKTSIEQIEDGQLCRVLRAWRGLDFQYKVTYENRARYAELVAEATAIMRGESIEQGSACDITTFNPSTWHGHWEGDDGFWLVISGYGDTFNFNRSGDCPREEIQFVSISQDHAILKFQEGERWLHTLTLKNKYEAAHEWLSLDSNAVGKTDRLNKLVPASSEQKHMTQHSNNPITDLHE